MHISEILYKTAAALKMEAVHYVETRVSGYQTLRRHTAEQRNVKSAVLPAVQLNRHCLQHRTQPASRCVAVPICEVQSVSTAAASHIT